MDGKDLKISRRDLLKGALIAVGVAALPVKALAAGKTPKATAQYQDHPKNGQHCSQCRFFIPGKGGGAGQCQLVAGSISPNGWCVFFNPKS